MSAFEGNSREETMENEKGRLVDLVPELQGLNMSADEVEDEGRDGECKWSEQEEDKPAEKKPAEGKQEDTNEKPPSKSSRRVLDILADSGWNPGSFPCPQRDSTHGLMLIIHSNRSQLLQGT
jgi:hypothetical protein